MKTLITVPDLRKRGGVAGYFTALRTHFDEDVFYFTRGARTGEVMPLFRIIRDYIGFYRAASDVDVGLVHLNTSLSAGGIFRDAGFILLAKMLRKKVIVFFRGWDSRFQRRIEKYGLRLFSRIYFKADGLIVLGIEFEEIFRQWGYRGPIFRETTAFDERLLEEAGVPAIPQKEDGRFNILFLSRVERTKGIYELVEAFRIVKEKDPAFRLVIAGDGGELESVKRYVAENQVQGVEFLGYVGGEAKRRALKDADVYVFPTQHGEGMPNSVLEAMAFGIPVVARNVGGLKDFFVHERMGFLTDSVDPEIYAEFILRLAREPRLCAAISEFNRSFAREHFYSGNVARRLQDIYEEVVVADSDDQKRSIMETSGWIRPAAIPGASNPGDDKGKLIA